MKIYKFICILTIIIDFVIVLELLKELDTLSYDLILKEVKKLKSEYELFQKMVNRKKFQTKNHINNYQN